MSIILGGALHRESTWTSTASSAFCAWFAGSIVVGLVLGAFVKAGGARNVEPALPPGFPHCGREVGQSQKATHLQLHGRGFLNPIQGDARLLALPKAAGVVSPSQACEGPAEEEPGMPS